MKYYDTIGTAAAIKEGYCGNCGKELLFALVTAKKGHCPHCCHSVESYGKPERLLKNTDWLGRQE